MYLEFCGLIIREFRFTRAVFRLSQSTFLLGATLAKLLESNESISRSLYPEVYIQKSISRSLYPEVYIQKSISRSLYPEMVREMEEGLYVDDLTPCGETGKRIVNLKGKCITIFSEGGF